MTLNSRSEGSLQRGMKSILDIFERLINLGLATLNQADSAMARICPNVNDLLTRIGKKPVVIQKEVPGFVANRLQGALLREALWLVQRGVVTAQDVDVIIKSSIGRRWAVAGVFEIFELVGMDLVLAVAEYLFPRLENSTEIPPVLRQKVERGDLGVKAGKGFYEWTPNSAEALRQRIAHALVETEKWSR